MMRCEGLFCHARIASSIIFVMLLTTRHYAKRHSTLDISVTRRLHVDGCQNGLDCQALIVVMFTPSECNPRIFDNLLFCCFFLKIFGGHKHFRGATDTPALGLWWRLPWVSKPGFIPFCVLSCLCDPQIHLWCNTCWLYRGQHGS